MDQEIFPPRDSKRKREDFPISNLPQHQGNGSTNSKRTREHSSTADEPHDPESESTGTSSLITHNHAPPLPPAQGFFHGAKDFVIENSIMTDIQGDVIFRFEGPPTEELNYLFTQHMEGLVTVKDLDKIAVKMKEHALSEAIRNLPRVNAAYNDYTQSKRRRSPCFKNTRQTLLKEIALCITSTDGPRAYLLFGIAGVGKSTVAQTVAERADNLRLLGASFFFSRDEADRRTAEKLFTSIAFQLCIHDKQFAEAIGDVLTKERGAAAISKDPQEQLMILIIEPLRDIVKSRSLPTVIVVDALDECDIDDSPTVLIALSRLVQDLPSFKVVLTTRPQSHLQYLLSSLGAHHVFRMEDIEQKIVDGDIRLYLDYNLSPDQVFNRLPMLRRKWAANNEEIDSLVKASGRLFIIASTALLFILDTNACSPASRMKTLQEEISRNRTPFDKLNDFYTVILRTAVPLGCGHDVIERYQLVVGTIVVIEDPLPVGILANLIDIVDDDVYYVLGSLQSVISLGTDDVPLVYHKSFPDYVTDDKRCRDSDLCIVREDHHTRLATRCFRVMNTHLKRNILGLGALSQYLDNDDALEEDHLSRDDVQRMIPSKLQYASVHWANHLVRAGLEDGDLMTELRMFIREHLLHWLETLSWIAKLNTAHVSLSAVMKLLTLDSEMREMLHDVFTFVSRHYEGAAESALYTYHSALPFTPTETLLYRVYEHQALLFKVEGGPERWDLLIAEKTHDDGKKVSHVAFAKDNSQFASRGDGAFSVVVKLWDGTNGSPATVGPFYGEEAALADDLSVLAMSHDSTVTAYSASSNAPVASFDHSSMVDMVAVSFDGSWLAAGLQSGTVHIWDVAKRVSIGHFDDYDGGLLKFSPQKHLLAFASQNGIGLWSQEDAAVMLNHELEKPVDLVFSPSSARLATVAVKDDAYSLRLWSGEHGDLIAVARDVGEKVAISADGSSVATGGEEKRVQLWSGDSLALIDTFPIDHITSLAFSGDLLAFAAYMFGVALHDTKSKTLITVFSIFFPSSLAFSPDGTRLVAGSSLGTVNLWDVPSVEPPTTKPEPSSSPVLALAFSLDCKRLASGRRDGSVELWDTGNMQQSLSHHTEHSHQVRVLAFSPDGDELASGSYDQMVFWDGGDSSPRTIIEHSFSDEFTSLALSASLLAAATKNVITLWDRTSLQLIHTFNQCSNSLSLSLDGSVLASTDSHEITVWDTGKLAVTATFADGRINTSSWLLFSPDGSKLLFQDGHYGFALLDIVNEAVCDAANEDLSWVPGLNGIVMTWTFGYGCCLLGRFLERRVYTPVFRAPHDVHQRSFASQSSMFALGCQDGRILLVRPRMSC